MNKKIFLALLISILSVNFVQAESLFLMGVSQGYYAEPKSLYGGVRARGIGDILTIIVEETLKTNDNLSFDTERTSNTVDNFTGLINSFWRNAVKPEVNGFGGTNTVKSSVKNNRSMTFNDTVTVQVVQLLPNGNLMVQGKKTIVNSNEIMDLLVSGVVDPRYINDSGQVSSKNVANLQYAVNGKGSTSRADNEGVINRVIRYLF